MRHDIASKSTRDLPAAFPLLGLVAGLAIGPLLVNSHLAFAGLVAVCAGGGLLAFLRQKSDPAATFRRAIPILFLALGIALATDVEQRTRRERAQFARFDPERFVQLEVPIDHDWAEREGSYILRAPRFVANGIAFDTPIALYTRFEPPQIANEATLRAEAFVRTNDRGEYTAGIKSAALMSYEGALPWWHPKGWNRALANRLEASARDSPDEVALAQALLLGRGERLSEEMRESFRRGGTYHLLVFSGLQIAFAAALLAAMLRWLHAPRVSDWLLLVFAMLAPAFIGPTASVSRASIGIALYALSRILKRPTAIENLWCLAALLRLLVEPRDLTDASFHLTYAGAGALLFIGNHLAKRRWAAHALAAEVAIAPLTLFHFHQYALGGALLTFVMAPLIFAMLVASLVACAFSPALAAIGVLHRLCAMLNTLGYSGYFAAPPLPAVTAAGVGSLLALALLRGRARAVALLIVLLAPSAAAVQRSVSRATVEHPRVTFFDVGQADAIALRSGDETMLVDGGRDSRLLPLLADRGIRQVDTVVLTHAHPDHCASLPALIEQFGVRRVLVTARRFHGDCATRILEACSRSATPLRVVRDGDRLRHGAFELTVHLTGTTFRRAPENNASIVLLASAEGRRFLLTGDLEKEGELALAGRDLRADVLKVAHHGSRSSTRGAFLDNVRPRLAVISCGRRNLFNHPHPSVLEALHQRGIVVRRTDRHGTVDVEVRGGRVYVRNGND